MSHCPYCSSTNTSTHLHTKDYFLSQEKFSVQHCQACGLHFTEPRPSVEILGKYYQSDQYISHDDSKSGILGVIYKTVRTYALYNKEKLVKKYANNKKILDFGCGSGAFLHYLKKKNWNVSGVEYDDNTRNKVNRTTGIPVQKDISTLLPNSVDVITAWHVIEHVYDLKATIEGLTNLLTPKGKLIIAVPNIKSPDASFYKEHWAALDVPRHLYHFDEATLSQILENAKLKKIAILPMVFDSFYISLISTKYKYGKFNIIEAFWQGLLSNIQSIKKTPNHSSLIYVFEKKEF